MSRLLWTLLCVAAGFRQEASQVLGEDFIWVVKDGICYYSSKYSKETMCLQAAGCWPQDEMVWGKRQCPSKLTVKIDWEPPEMPCGKPCAE